MMTCKEVLDSISSLVDDDLKQEVVVEMQRHIGACSDCRAEFDSINMTLKLYKHVDSPQLPAGCHDRLVKVLKLEALKGKPADDPGSIEV